jgi:hypothetical protein
MSAKETMEVGANLVAFTLTKSVALGTSSFKEVCTLLHITYKAISNSSLLSCNLKDVLEGFVAQGLFKSLRSENLKEFFVFKCAKSMN